MRCTGAAANPWPSRRSVAVAVYRHRPDMPDGSGWERDTILLWGDGAPQYTLVAGTVNLEIVRNYHAQDRSETGGENVLLAVLLGGQRNQRQQQQQTWHRRVDRTETVPFPTGRVSRPLTPLPLANNHRGVGGGGPRTRELAPTDSRI